MQNNDNKVKKPTTEIGIRMNAMILALKKTLGNITESANMVGMDRDNHYVWLRKYPEYKKAFEQIQESNLDFVEGKMYKRINGYEHPDTKVFLYKGKVITKETVKHYPPDSGLIKFYLETIGKSRGYIPRIENINKTVEEFDKTEEDLIKELEQLDSKIID